MSGAPTWLKLQSASSTEMKIVTGIRDLDQDDLIGLRVFGRHAVIRIERFLAQFSLATGETHWVVERRPVRPISRRAIQLFGQEELLWFNGRVVAELCHAEGGAARIEARDSSTGRLLWEHLIPRAGPPTEEVRALIADDPNNLVVLLTREDKVPGFRTPTARMSANPPAWCQTDAIRFDVVTGRQIWSAKFDNVSLGVDEQRSFSGLWSTKSRVGVIDLEKGTNSILYSSPRVLGAPIRDGTGIVVPWIEKKGVGVEWLDQEGQRIRVVTWDEPRAREISLHPTDDGLGVQTNSQSLWWLGRESLPIWRVRAKPYIYRVHRSAGSDVFVGTDGMGGRLLAFDAITGREILSIKPKLGGFGDLTRIPGRALLASTFMVSRTYPLQCRLFVINMIDRHQTLRDDSSSVLGAWEGGVVGRTGRAWEQVAIFDIP